MSRGDGSNDGSHHICCDPSLQPSRRDGSNDGSHNMFLWRNKAYYYDIIPDTPSYLGHCKRHNPFGIQCLLDASRCPLKRLRGMKRSKKLEMLGYRSNNTKESNNKLCCVPTRRTLEEY